MNQEDHGVTRTAGLTAEDLLCVSDPAHRFELVDGRLLVREPAGFRHGRVVATLATILGTHVREHRLGVVLTGDAGFILRRGPDTVRAPDVSFVSRARIPDPEPVSFAELAPDLAVEIVSPSNSPDQIAGRVRDLLAAGTRLIWILDPETQGATIHRPHREPEHLASGGEIDGEDVLPGFRCSLEEIFRDPGLASPGPAG